MIKTSTKNRFFCLLLATMVMLCTLTSINVSAISSIYSEGGYAKVTNYANVLGTNNEVLAQVEPGEGVTLLYYKNANYAFIECNTPNGPMQGSVLRSALQIDASSVCAQVTTSSNTYYSPNASMLAGSVDQNEFVAVLALKNGWAYIEYNVANAQRKRAYIQESRLNLFYHTSTIPTPTFYQDNRIIASIHVYSQTTIYSGPNGATYSDIGYVTEEDNGEILAYKRFTDRDGDIMYYVGYPTSAGTKYGYIYA